MQIYCFVKHEKLIGSLLNNLFDRDSADAPYNQETAYRYRKHAEHMVLGLTHGAILVVDFTHFIFYGIPIIN